MTVLKNLFANPVGATTDHPMEVTTGDSDQSTGAKTTLGYCGVCRDWYEVTEAVVSKCPLCGYRPGDL